MTEENGMILELLNGLWLARSPCVWLARLERRERNSVCMCLYVCVHMCVFVCICMCVCTYVCPCVCLRLRKIIIMGMIDCGNDWMESDCFGLWVWIRSEEWNCRLWLAVSYCDRGKGMIWKTINGYWLTGSVCVWKGKLCGKYRIYYSWLGVLRVDTPLWQHILVSWSVGVFSEGW